MDKEQANGFARFAVGVATVIAAIALLVCHFLVWVFLALDASGDSAPTRVCPCPFVATPWSFVFWAPEAALLGGFALALAFRKDAGIVALGAVLTGFVALVVVTALYADDVRRMWSVHFPAF